MVLKRQSKAAGGCIERTAVEGGVEGRVASLHFSPSPGKKGNRTPGTWKKQLEKG